MNPMYEDIADKDVPQARKMGKMKYGQSWAIILSIIFAIGWYIMPVEAIALNLQFENVQPYVDTSTQQVTVSGKVTCDEPTYPFLYLYCEVYQIHGQDFNIATGNTYPTPQCSPTTPAKFVLSNMYIFYPGQIQPGGNAVTSCFTCACADESCNDYECSHAIKPGPVKPAQ